MRIILALLLAMALFACKGIRPLSVTSESVSTVITETERDTLIVFEADTALVSALFACDSLNQVYMVNLSVLNGKRLEPEVIFQNQVFTVKAKIDSSSVYLKWKERYEVTEHSTQQTITKVERVVYKPPWLKFLAGFGGIMLLSLIVTIGYKIIKIFK